MWLAPVSLLDHLLCFIQTMHLRNLFTFSSWLSVCLFPLPSPLSFILCLCLALSHAHTHTYMYQLCILEIRFECTIISLTLIINIYCCVWITGPTERGMGQLAHILPDYMLVFAVPVLAHDPDFTSNEDVEQLTRVRQCLWFILEPLMTKNEFYCFGFYKNLIERMKNHKDALKGEDDSMNHVSLERSLITLQYSR